MSEPVDHTADQDDRALAGEYLLGLLSAQEAASFQARLEQEPELNTMVAQWAESLVSISDEVTPVTPPKHLKAGLDAQLFGTDQAVQQSFGWLRNLFGGLAVIAALAVAVFLFTGQDKPSYTAQIAAEDASLLVATRYFEDTGYLEFERKAGLVKAGRSHELWLIQGENAPVSLGVIPTTERGVIIIDAGLRGSMKGAILAISDEPEGGSPTGVATGAVLAVGPVTGA